MQSRKVNKLTYEFIFSKEDEFNYVLMSDIHVDNPKCDRDYFFSHLDKAKKKKAKVFIFGDLFCFMQGKYDPRRSKSDIRPEHNKANYIDAVIDDTVDILKPYADTIVFVSEGNHETAILKNLETDVLERFVSKYNQVTGANVLKGSYRGWVILKKEYAENKCTPYRIYYHHGYGGGGEMTKGVLQHSRMNMHIEGADAIVMGHVHESYILNTKTEYFDSSPNSQEPKSRLIYNIRTACYKEEFVENGFHIEKGRPPKPIGCVYGELEIERTANQGRDIISNYTMWVK